MRRVALGKLERERRWRGLGAVATVGSVGSAAVAAARAVRTHTRDRQGGMARSDYRAIAAVALRLLHRGPLPAGVPRRDRRL